MSPINPDVEKFCEIYIATGNEVHAYRKVFYGRDSFIAKSAKSDASAFLRSVDVRNTLALKTRAALRPYRLEGKAVLDRLAQIAFANITEVVKVRRVNCRHCWGKKFKYQYTPGEYDQMCVDSFIDAQNKKTEAAWTKPPVPEGGLKFDATRKPHPDCPECRGEGYAETFIEDFDKISDDVKPLIASVENTKYGLKVTFHSQTQALETLAKCFGLLQPDVAMTFIQQMMPQPVESEIFEARTYEQQHETYKRLLNS